MAGSDASSLAPIQTSALSTVDASRNPCSDAPVSGVGFVILDTPHPSRAPGLLSGAELAGVAHQGDTQSRQRGGMPRMLPSEDS